MGISEILALVVRLVPVARQVIETLRGAQADPHPSEQVLDLIAQLSPVAAKLMMLITDIRTQTIEQHPAVWAAVRADYALASSEFDALMVAAKKP